MAKRKSGDGDALNLDSLMDTVTNVVGVLMIVLITVSLNIAASVNKILSELPPVALEELERLKQKLADITPKPDPKKVDEETKKLDQELQKKVEELKTLDLSAAKQSTKLVDLDEVRKKLDEAKKQRDGRKTETDKLLAEIDKLKALLDTTPVYKPPPATVVRLPNPRPMPEKAVLQRFLVMGGRVIYLNDAGMEDFIATEAEKNGRTLQAPTKGKPPRPVYDQPKLLAHFTRARVATRELQVELVPSPASPRLPMKIIPLPEAGETVEQIKNPAAVFQRALRKFKSEPDNVVQFYVYKDSIETYLAAREIADAIGVPVTWEITGNNFFQRGIYKFDVTYTPPKDAPPPRPAGLIAAPKAGID